MILCDTNILIEFFKDNAQIVLELRQIGQNRIGISHITQAELYFGALDKSELKKMKRHFLLLCQFPVNLSISKRFLHLMEGYSLSHNLSIPDALIAATALEHMLELYTLNTKDFQFIPGLMLYHPQSY